MTHTHTFNRTPLDERLAHRRNLYLTTHNIQKRQTSMSPVGFEPAIPPSEQPQTYAFDHVATRTSIMCCFLVLSIYIRTYIKKND
jgi:hypothetical protein